MVSRKMRGYNSIVSRFSGAKKMGKDRARKSTSTACNGGRRKVCSEARRKRLRGDRRDCCRQCDVIMMVKSEFLKLKILNIHVIPQLLRYSYSPLSHKMFNFSKTICILHPAKGINSKLYDLYARFTPKNTEMHRFELKCNGLHVHHLRITIQYIIMPSYRNGNSGHVRVHVYIHS